MLKPATKLGWITYQDERATLVRCTDYDEVLYVLTVADLADVYEEDRPERWEQLAPEMRQALVRNAARALQDWPEADHDFADVFRGVIEAQPGQEAGD